MATWKINNYFAFYIIFVISLTLNKQRLPLVELNEKNQRFFQLKINYFQKETSYNQTLVFKVLGFRFL